MPRWLRIWLGPLPDWTQPNHPIVRYELQRAAENLNARQRLLRAFGLACLIALAIVFALLVVSAGLTQPAGANIPDTLWRVLFAPVFAVQLGALVLSFALASSLVDEERRRQTWDPLRATEQGATLALRARWLGVMFRLRLLLGLILTARLIFVVGLLWQLTAHRGAYLDALLAAVVPETNLVIGIILLAAALTAAVLLPFIHVGMAAALGLIVAAWIRARGLSGAAQAIFAVLILTLATVLLLLMSGFLSGALPMDRALTWLLHLLYTVLGDWGLLSLHLAESGLIWALIPYSILSGVIALAIALLEAAAIDRLLRAAGKRAEASE